MNRKQLILLLVVLAVLGGAGLVLLNQHKESWAVHEAKIGDKVLPGFQPNEVAAIHIKGASELNVVRKNNVWGVQERGDYPANFGQISDLLIKLKDLKVVEAETVDPSDLARVQLEEPGNGSDSGTLVEFKDAQGKLLASLLAGKQFVREQSETSRLPMVGGSSDGRYILSPQNPKEAMLIADPLAILTPKPGAWLSREFFKVEKIKSVSLATADGAISWKLSREAESSPWTLRDAKPGEDLDAYFPSSLANAMNFIRFADVAINTSPAKTSLDKPTIMSIETFDHFAYTLKIGAQTADGNRYFSVSVSDGSPASETKQLQDKLKQEQSLAQWFYLINSNTAELLTRDRARILKGATPPKPAANPMEKGGWTPRVIQ